MIPNEVQNILKRNLINVNIGGIGGNGGGGL